MLKNSNSDQIQAQHKLIDIDPLLNSPWKNKPYSQTRSDKSISNLLFPSNISPANFIDSAKFRFSRDSKNILTDYLEFDIISNKGLEEEQNQSFKKMNFSIDEFELSQKIAAKEQILTNVHQDLEDSKIINIDVYGLNIEEDDSENLSQNSFESKKSDKNYEYQFETKKSNGFDIKNNQSEVGKNEVNLDKIEEHESINTSNHFLKESLKYLTNEAKIMEKVERFNQPNIPSTKMIAKNKHFEHFSIENDILSKPIQSQKKLEHFSKPTIPKEMAFNVEMKKNLHFLHEQKDDMSNYIFVEPKDDIHKTRPAFTDSTFGNMINQNKSSTDQLINAEYMHKELLLEEEQLKNEMMILDKKLKSLKSSIFKLNLKHQDILFVLSDAYNSGETRRSSEISINFQSIPNESETEKDGPSLFFEPSFIDQSNIPIHHSLIKPRIYQKDVQNSDEMPHKNDVINNFENKIDQVKISKFESNEVFKKDALKNFDEKVKLINEKTGSFYQNKTEKDQFDKMHFVDHHNEEMLLLDDDQPTKIASEQEIGPSSEYQTFALKASKFQTLGQNKFEQKRSEKSLSKDKPIINDKNEKNNQKKSNLNIFFGNNLSEKKVDFKNKFVDLSRKIQSTNEFQFEHEDVFEESIIENAVEIDNKNEFIVEEVLEKNLNIESRQFEFHTNILTMGIKESASKNSGLIIRT